MPWLTNEVADVAKDEHVVLLDQGVDAWNEWRRENPEVVPDLTSAHLSGKNLSGAKLSGVNLRGKDLMGANLHSVDLRGANLLDATLDNANLTAAKLWSTQRDGWSIKDVTCEYAFWDREAKERTDYSPAEFERLHSEGLTVAVHYKGGIQRTEVNTLPLLLQHLENSNAGCVLRLKSIEDAPGGAQATIVVEETGRHEPAELQTKLQEQGQSHQEELRWLIDNNPRLLEQLSARMYDEISARLFARMLEHAGTHDKAFLNIENIETVEKIEKVGIVGDVADNAKVDIDQ